MFCAVTSDEDGVTTTSLNIASAVRNDNNVTLKNLHVDDVIPGATGGDAPTMLGPYYLDFTVYDGKRPYDIRFNPGTLPKGTRVHLFFPKFKTCRSLKASLHGVKPIKAKGIRIPHRPDEVCGEPTRYDAKQDFVLDVGRPMKGERAGVYGIVPEGEQFSTAFYVELPKRLKTGARYTFHIEHWIANDQVGGSSYEFRVRKTVTKPGKRRPPRRPR